MDGNIIFWGMGISAALLTAFYMFRLVFMTFHGESRVDPRIHPHESPKVMTMPLVVLAGPVSYTHLTLPTILLV